jgi:colanic acid/amylovoran biosynthesis protein
MRILINNTALRNNGDVLLVESLALALKKRGHAVSIATSYREIAKENFPFSDVCREVFGEKLRIFRRRWFADIASIFLLIFSKTYRKADLVIGAPGGYLNSFYGFFWKMNIYRWSKVFGKRVAIFSQSVGPLTDRDKNNILVASKYIDRLFVRDLISREWSLNSGISHNKVILTDDAAFLTEPHRSKNWDASQKAIFSVREWKYEGRNIEKYVEMIKSMVRVTVLNGYEVEFISTCQGVAGYIDDSSLAKKIAAQLADEGITVEVVEKYMSLKELKISVERAQFVVGTRLHMCLLAILAGIPAFNISYEKKGAECYASLDMPDFSIDYNESEELANFRFTNFISRLKQARSHILCAAEEKNKLVNECLDQFLREI